MRAARIENGVVADLWEVPALDSYDGVTLVAAPDAVGMGWGYAGGVFTAPARVLSEAATAKRTQLAKAYQAAMYADVTVAGKVFPADRDYQFTILTMASRANRGRPIPATIRGKDGVPVPLTPALLGLVEDGLFDQGKVAADNLAAKVAAVKSATTVEQLDAVVW